jgi:hypothetical protein
MKVTGTGAKFGLLRMEIEKIISKSAVEEDPGHSVLTLKWVLKFKPDADEALMIAALAHDIDRAVNGTMDVASPPGLNEMERAVEHAIRSANITSKLMKNLGYDEEIISRVRYLIEHHIKGGDEEANMLVSADSLSFFEHNIYYYIKAKGIEKTKKKVRWMFNKMSDKTKKLAKQIKFREKEVKKLFKEAITESQ